ncbi:Sec-independent protein translocase protein TatB [Pseudoxanthomonas sacheonensis]|uniref:Sec-independent protein translocase protein TatB n=1 Tax=Pseudoxanthomonas sacheonensis TaxID=443615 RepID=A0ABU1RSY4_9GAMM|nr:Sec-independent protein translocase protein TatB [Pseudoxanthomonas sacheonensis]MDR6841888.1 sec-independent protein translocase protein TatB [Pseudoxanthomonas sacheonensis]
MFGISSGELFFIAIIALIVLGPERLPKVTRMAGMWVRRARTQWNSVKDELERELTAEELKRSLHDAQSALQDTEQRIRDSGAEARREFEQMRASVQQPDGSGAAPAPVSEEPAPAPPSKPQEGESDEPRNA